MNEKQGSGRIRYSLVFSCSGAADLGMLTDRVAHKLSSEKSASMCCAAAVAAGVPSVLEKVRGAERIIALDGCESDCVKTILEKAGVTQVIQLRLEDLGFIKGKTPITEERIAKIALAAIERLEAQIDR